ncbi:MAG: Gmad2 immunoglobulin-like domain-containing protein [Aquihabitans sp.]
MTTEDRLRRAITERTDHVEPVADGLTVIEETLIQPTPMSTRNKWFMGGAAAAVVALVAVAAIALTNDDDSSQVVATDPAVTTTVAPQSTVTTEMSVPPTSVVPTTEVVPPAVVTASSVVWPRPGGDKPFDDPVTVARSFAIDYAGFSDPTVGPFSAGDSRLGEVEIRPDADSRSPATTVLVRQMKDDNWYVIAANTPNILISEIGRDDNITSGCPGPVSITGLALAFEGTVGVRIDAFDSSGSRVELGQGFGTGAGSPPMAPFEADILCEAVPSGPSSDAGVVMVWEDSAKDGSRLVVAASAFSFAP